VKVGGHISAVPLIDTNGRVCLRINHHHRIEISIGFGIGIEIRIEESQSVR